MVSHTSTAAFSSAGRQLGGNFPASRLSQAFDKRRARRAGASVAAPQPEIAIGAEGPADCSEIFGLGRGTLDRPVAGRKVDPAGRAVRDYVNGVEIAAVGEGRDDLVCDRPHAVEQCSLDSRPHMAEDDLDIRNRRIDKKRLAAAGHGKLPGLILLCTGERCSVAWGGCAESRRDGFHSGRGEIGFPG